MTGRREPHVTEILKKLESIITYGDAYVRNEALGSLMHFLERIAPILKSTQNVELEDFPEQMQVAMKGVEAELEEVETIINMYKEKSRMFVLIHSAEVVQSIQDISNSLGHWLSLFLLVEHPEIQELKNKILELSKEMQAVQFKLNDDEKIALHALEEKARNPEAEMGNMQLVMNHIIHALCLDPSSSKGELLIEVQDIVNDIQDRQDEHEQQLVTAIQNLLSQYAEQREDSSKIINASVEDDDPISPFETFLCPLTKQIMKDPVLIESEQTFDRSGIERWFQQCKDQGRELSCPLTGRKLTSSELRPNYSLRHTIDEWNERNVRKRIEIAATNLEHDASIKEKERALVDILKIAEESSLNKYKLKDAGLITLILNTWQFQVEDDSHLQSNSLKALLSMVANNSDNKVAMVEAGALKLIVRSMNCNIEEDKENAFRLMFELSKQSDICHRICLQKGAILYLTGATVNLENLAVSSLAEKTLQNLEQEDSTVCMMAESGRLRPLLKRLHQGPEELQVKIADYIAQATLLNTAKERIANAGAITLVQLLFSHIQAKKAGLGALLNLSTFEENTITLIKAGTMPPVLNIMFNLHSTSDSKVKEMASDLLANLVAFPGHWEDVVIDSEGNTLQSQFVIHSFLGLLTHVAADWKQKLLRILLGMVSSPQVAGAVAEHFKTGGGLPLLVNLLKGTELQIVLSLRVLNALSLCVGADILETLRREEKLSWLKEMMRGNVSSSSEAQTVAAAVLCNIPLTDEDLTNSLGVELIEWIMRIISNNTNTKSGSSQVLRREMLESLLGVLLHFTCSNNRSVIEKMKEHQLLLFFKKQLSLPVPKLAKQRAIKGMKSLSEKSIFLARDTEKAISKGFCAPLMSLCGLRPLTHQCSVHFGVCEGGQTFCLVHADAVRPLVDLLEEDDLDLRTAVIEAISTLLNNSLNFKGGVKEIQKVGGVHLIFEMFTKLRVGELQEKTVWIVERCLCVEECAQNYLIDQHLFKALVEVFKHGTPTARNLAKEGLIHLKRLSGVAMKGKIQELEWQNINA